MEKPVKGDVVVLPFPFSDLSSSKKRPALVMAKLPGDDLILCQITSKLKVGPYSISLNDSDFKTGSLNVDSLIKISRIFTADKAIVLYKIGTLKQTKIDEVERKIVELFKK